MRAKLTKIPYRDLTIIQEALEKFNEYLIDIKNTLTFSDKKSGYFSTASEETMMYMSVCQEMTKEISKKLNRDFVQKTYSLNLPYFKIKVFTTALLYYVSNFEKTYENAVLNKFIMALKPRLIKEK